MSTKHSPTLAILISIIAISIGTSDTAIAASQDNNVEWFGVSHFSWEDRRPLCPVDGESFSVHIQALQNDLTAVRVQVDDGTPAWIDAAVQFQDGPYDVWVAIIPATIEDALTYSIELTDGTDTDYYGTGGMSETPAPPFTIDSITLEHAPYGATPLPGGGVVFRVWSPTTTSAHTRGEFNGWTTADPMSRVNEDWIVRIPGAVVGEQYKYFFSNSVWNSDPRARRLNATDNNNSIILDPFSYAWQIPNFDTPDREEMVIYQVHIGTFAGRNDPVGTTSFPSTYTDIADRADHFADLGINCVMIMPINEFPGDESAGYNPISNFAPEWIYGTPDEMKQMVDELHARGIAVILDIVWNHFSFSDNFLWFYDGTQIYFDDPAVDTPWGAQADFDNGNVRQYFLDSAHAWLDEFQLDGFRMDATDFMNLPEQEAAGWSLMQALNDQADNRWGDSFLIAEQLPDDAWVTRPTSLGGAGFDAQYFDRFTDDLRQEIFDAASGNPEMAKIASIINGGGSFLNGRYVVNYLELHDEVWPTSGGQRIVRTIDTTAPHDDVFAQGRTKLAQGLVFTAPGTPAMHQGTEWLEDQNFGTSINDRIDWSHKTTYAHIYRYYQDLIALRTSNPALRSGSPHEVYRVDDSSNVIVFQRFDFDGNVLSVVANFSNNDYTGFRIGLPQPNEWSEAINSQSLIYGGNGLDNPGIFTAEEVPWDGHPWSAELNIPAMGLMVLRHESETSDVPEDVSQAQTGVQFRSITNPMRESCRMRFALPEAGPVRIEVYDAQGRRVAVPLSRDLSAGDHEVVWNGRDSQDRRVTSGVYSLVLWTEQGRDRGRIAVIR